MKCETLEGATVRRYLQTLNDLRSSPTREVRDLATELLLDMGLPGVSVSECLAPIITLPIGDLTPAERAVRFAAQRH